MNGVTVGRNFHPGIIIPLEQNAEEVFQPVEGEPRFRLVLVEEGTGILRLHGRRNAFVAPTVFCLNDLDEPELERSADLRARAFYFHPSVINSAFNLENIRSSDSRFSMTENQDLLCLRAFLSRNENYSGQINIGPVSTKRIAGLFDTIHRGLTMQDEQFWPCRSRSYFLETLFLVERIYSTPGVTEEIALPETSSDADSVILYLHTHYQERITIAELCRRFNINRTTLNEKFYVATGLPVMTYLIGLRIRVATQMLRDTTLPVADVMERVGFNDLSHFGRTFHRQTGMSPSEYRDRYCWMLPTG